MGVGGIALLTERQRVCLRMVYGHMSSKDIARELKISPHTVDQRLRFAIRHLGVSTRIEAAKILAAHEGLTPYHSALYQPSDIAELAQSAEADDALECGEQSPTPTEKSMSRVEPSMFPVSFSASLRKNWWPFPLREGELNELSYFRRLGWIIALAIGASLAFGMILAGMDALSHLI